MATNDPTGRPSSTDDPSVGERRRSAPPRTGSVEAGRSIESGGETGNSSSEATASRTGEQVLVVRLSSEIATKARTTRLRFTRKLARNLHVALRTLGVEFEIERQWSRLVVRIDHPEAAAVAARVFGVHSVSVATAQPYESLDDIVEAGRPFFEPAVAGKVFAARAKRVDPGNKVPFASTDVERALGGALYAGAAGVDLENPEVTVEVEVHPDRFYLLGEPVTAEGGLPLGIDSRALALVSGGFDSAVASWELLRRGVALHYLFFNLGGRIHRLGTSRVMRVVARDWSYGYRPALHVVDLRPAVDDMRRKAPGRFWQVLLKRLMIRGAERVATELRMPGLVTGDAIGQVSSQTLENLAVISQATERPILRPLIAANKQSIVDRAKRIGTYELSAAIGEFCALDAKNPTTKAPLDALLEMEAALDATLLDRALDEREEVDLLEPEPLDDRLAELGVDTVPEGALVVDLRKRDAYRRWHYAGAIHASYDALLRDPKSLPDAPRYLFYCEVGLKSVHLAETLAVNGIEARYFSGGAADLQSAELGDDPLAGALRAPAVR